LGSGSCRANRTPAPGVSRVDAPQKILDRTSGKARCRPTHDLDANVERIEFRQIDEVFERLLRGDVKYRFVIDLASLKQRRARAPPGAQGNSSRRSPRISRTAHGGNSV
jgi:hypothetical protein